MTLLEVSMHLSFPAHGVTTRVHALVNPYPLTCLLRLRGKTVFSHLEYIKVRSHFNLESLWDFSSIKSLVRDYKLIFPIKYTIHDLEKCVCVW